MIEVFCFLFFKILLSDLQLSVNSCSHSFYFIRRMTAPGEAVIRVMDLFNYTFLTRKTQFKLFLFVSQSLFACATIVEIRFIHFLPDPHRHRDSGAVIHDDHFCFDLTDKSHVYQIASPARQK